MGRASAALFGLASAAIVIGIRKRRSLNSAAKPKDGDDGVDEHRDRPDAKLRRLRKCETVLRDRIGRVTIVLERTNKSHNFAAILRTAEAMGFQNIYLVSVVDTVVRLENEKMKAGKQKARWAMDDSELSSHLGIAKGASKWLSIRIFETAQDCIRQLKRDGCEIWVTDLSQQARTLGFSQADSIDQALLPNRLAFVMGTESSGISQTFVDNANERVYLPMHGFADSYNLSVSCAMMMQLLILRDPSIIGSLTSVEKQTLRANWYQQLARTPEEKKEFQGYLTNPPKPFKDNRRADEHRVPRMKPNDLKRMVGYAPGR